MVDLYSKVRRRRQREIGYAQDIIVELIYRVIPDAVLHGGTLIWRCYGGNRFSEDLDFYVVNREKVDALFHEIEKAGFRVAKLKITDNSVFSRVVFGDVELRIEMLFKNVEGKLMSYECMDGRRIPIRGIEARQLILEKVSAFNSRRKARDLYDIYHLLNYTKDVDGEIRDSIRDLISKFERPKDESELRSTVLSGYIPSSIEILEFLKRWAR